MLQSLLIFTQSSGILNGGNLWAFIGIAVAACILGVEVACIAILIRKLLQARRNRKAQEAKEAEERYANYAAAMLFATAIPFSAELVFSVLVGLVAVASVLLLVLLIVFRACGYDYVAADLLREKEHRSDEQSAAAEKEEAPIPAPAGEQDGHLSLPADEPEEPIPAPEPEPEVLVAAESEPQEEMPEPEQEPEEPAADEETPVQEIPEVGQEQQPAEEPAVAAFAGGMAPVNESVAAGAANTGNQGAVRSVHIEKEYIETTKEEIRTAPAASSAPASSATNTETASPATERLIEKLSTLIDKMDQKQENDAKKKTPDGDAKAVNGAEPEEEEDEEDDDLEEDSADDIAEDKLDEDADDEPDDPEHFTGNERIIGFDEETGCYIVAHYRKSFEAKLIQARRNIKQYYSELKNALLAYGGTKSRISWAADSFTNERDPIAKINVKTRTLELYLALDPASLDETVYKGDDVGHVKKYADTPFRYKIRSPRKFKWAMELVERVCEEHGLSPIDIDPVNYEDQYPFEDTDSLVSRGLIKEYIREEKPASTFELDESHVPSVPEVDETVIPANANISWELDNEQLAQKEPEPEPEPIPEPVPEPEPAPAPEPEPAPAPEPPQPESTPGTVIRETTKITRMRYTEQYYGAPGEAPAYQQDLANAPFISNDFFETPVSPETPEQTEEPAPEAPAQPEAPDTGAAEQETQAELAEEEQEAFAEPEAELDEPEFSPEEPEESEPEEQPEEESELLSAFEADTHAKEDDDDLDWGIPASLTIQTPVTVAEPEEEAAEDAEEPSWTEDAEEETVYEEPETFEEASLEEPDMEPDEVPEYDDSAEYAGEEAYAEEEEPYSEEETYSGEDGYYSEEPAYADESGYPAEEQYDESAAYEEDGYAYAEDTEYDTSNEYDASGEYGEYDEYADGTEYAEPEDGYSDAGYGYETDSYGEVGAYVGEEDANGDVTYTDEPYEEEAYVEEPYPEESDSQEAYEEPVTPIPQAHVNPNVALVDVSVLETNFPYGSVINLGALKAKGLVLPSAKVLKIFATGEITKAFTVEADQFSLDAIRAIDSAGGEILMVKK